MLAKTVAVFNYRVNRPAEIRDVTQINFLAETVGLLPVKLGRDHRAFAWIHLGEMKNYNLSRETRKVIESALR